MGLELRVSDLGFRVLVGFKVAGLSFGVGLGVRVWGFRV